jgi:ABC-2 type transport system permease protein
MAVWEATAVNARIRRARHMARVVRSVSALNIRAAMAYRGGFAATVLLGIMWQTSTLAFAGVLLTKFHGLGGFPARGVLLIIGVRMLAHGLYVVLFDTLAQLPLLVDEGRMEGYFLRPLPVFTQVLLSQFNMNGLGDVAAGATVFGFAVTLVDVRWTVGTAAYLAAAIVNGVLLEAAIQLVLSCLLLRSPASRMLGPWADELMMTFGNYPLSILPKAVQGLFTFVLPLAFVAYFPVEVILGIGPRHGVMLVIVRGSPCAGFAAFYLARRVWAWSLRHYRSVGG